MRKDILENRALIEKMIAANEPKVQIAKALDCKVDTLTSYLKKMGIEYSGNMSGKGKPQGNMTKTYVHAINYLYNGSTISSNNLKMKLFREKIKEKQCEICKGITWNDKDIPLELDHIDGNHYNNELKNLRILCPNCHAQTTTYCGRGKNRKKNI